jgi:SOS-response transcriptional repressor LexA
MTPEERKTHRQERLITLLNEKYGGQQIALANAADISATLVSRYVKGTKGIGEDMAAKIEGNTGYLGWFGISQEEARAVAPGILEPAPVLAGQVPVISWVQAGEFSEAVESWDTEEWVETLAPVLRHTFALRVKGDSMEPEFPSGVVIVVEPDLEPNPGDFVVVRNGGGEATFKQLVRDGEDWYLKPINPRYPIKPLGHSHVVGVVREMIKRFR